MAVTPLPDDYQREGGYLAVAKPEDLERGGWCMEIL